LKKKESNFGKKKEKEKQDKVEKKWQNAKKTKIHCELLL
jgi:hypothetical protein